MPTVTHSGSEAVASDIAHSRGFVRAWCDQSHPDLTPECFEVGFGAQWSTTITSTEHEPEAPSPAAGGARKTLHILIGPKGSGKTFIGTLLQRRLGIPFLRVEDIALAVKRERSHQDASYVHEVFGAIEAAVRERLRSSAELIIESTGLTEAFDGMLARLEQDFTVNLVRVRAGAETCLRRIKERDQSLHVDVSDAHVQQINDMVAAKSWPFKGEIDNQAADESALVAASSRRSDANRPERRRPARLSEPAVPPPSDESRTGNVAGKRGRQPA